MHLIGQPIAHGTFGKGVVTDGSDTTITVRFLAGEKTFLYPDAFSEFLTLENSAMQGQIQEILQEREAAKAAERQALQETQDRKSLLRNLRISLQSQAIFNIKAGEREELFSTWSVSTGCYVSGYSKGKPRIPDRLKPNSMCLLTECSSGQSEKERRIIGAFMVEEDFLGNYCQGGIINAHPTYRLQLWPEYQPLFWPYVTQEPEQQRWGRATFQYMSNKTGEKILFDIKELAPYDDLKEHTEEFYQYYCKLNRLRPRKKEKDMPAGKICPPVQKSDPRATC